MTKLLITLMLGFSISGHVSAAHGTTALELAAYILMGGTVDMEQIKETTGGTVEARDISGRVSTFEFLDASDCEVRALIFGRGFAIRYLLENVERIQRSAELSAGDSEASGIVLSGSKSVACYQAPYSFNLCSRGERIKVSRERLPDVLHAIDIFYSEYCRPPTSAGR